MAKRPCHVHHFVDLVVQSSVSRAEDRGSIPAFASCHLVSPQPQFSKDKHDAGDLWMAKRPCDVYRFIDLMAKASVSRALYTIQNKLRTNCSQTCQRPSFELNDLKF